jgi:hypothetical protein
MPLVVGGLVVLTVEGLPPIPLWVETDALRGSDTGIYFPSTDCSGDPFFLFTFSPAGPFLPLTFFVEQTGTIVYSETNATPQEIVVHSLLEEPGCSQLDAVTISSVPGFQAPPLQPFTPPFAVVTRGELGAP